MPLSFPYPDAHFYPRKVHPSTCKNVSFQALRAYTITMATIHEDYDTELLDVICISGIYIFTLWIFLYSLVCIASGKPDDFVWMSTIVGVVAFFVGFGWRISAFDVDAIPTFFFIVGHSIYYVYFFWILMVVTAEVKGESSLLILPLKKVFQ